MASIRRGLVIAVVAGALALPVLVLAANNSRAASPGSGVVEDTSTTRQLVPEAFSDNEKERYLSQEQLDYIRPGAKIKFLSVTDVAPGKKPVIEVSLTDSFDQPIDREGKITPGPINPGFVLSRWDPELRQYYAYTTRTRNGVTNPSADQGGTWTNLELGRYKYTFGTTLPANLDVTKTLTLGAYGRRTMTDIVGKDYYADNVFKEIRPDGQPVGEVWNAMKAATTCNNCHNPIAEHGGTRREVKMCMLCHTSQTTPSATGETFDGKVFFHKLHMGENLPSVEAGKPYVAGADFSKVVFPQDIRNCTTCHEAGTAESSIWYTRPSRAACASCHDDVNWTTGANHPGGIQADDTKCATCHVPEGDTEFDASIKGAHTVPYKSKQLAGLKATIISVTDAAPGKSPIVTFKLTNGDGTSLDPKPFGSNLNILLAGSTDDYGMNPIRENASGAAYDGSKSVYTFKAVLPTNAKGTWTASMEARRTVKLNVGTPKEQNFTEAAQNPIFDVAITGAVHARRVVANMASCNKCHDRLALHGGQRLVVQECVMCHNPIATDTNRRPADQAPPESVDFKRMIHRIHTGEEMTQDMTIYGFFTPPNPPNPINFNEVLFPGDRRDCVKCHSSAATAALPTGGVLSTTALRDYFATTPMGPGTTSCLGCHDLRDNAAHAWLNTAPFGEACATCHGTGRDWAVEKVNAR